MKVDANFSGLDEFLAEAEDEIKQGMIEIAHQGVDFAKYMGNTKIIPITFAVHPVPRL